MKVLTWNIRHGGGSRIPAIAAAIAAHAPDVAILTEYRTVAGRVLRDRLRDAGYPHVREAPMVARQNGVAVASRWPLVRLRRRSPLVPPHRWLEVHCPTLGASFAAFYGPLEEHAFDSWWTSVRKVVARRVKSPFLLAGDFNTGLSVVDAPRDPFYCAHHFQALQDLGMCDAWRSQNPGARDYSWFSIRGGREINGFRLDHALVSPALTGRLTRAHYSHAERKAGLSDHSILIVELDGRRAVTA